LDVVILLVLGLGVACLAFFGFRSIRRGKQNKYSAATDRSNRKSGSTNRGLERSERDSISLNEVESSDPPQVLRPDVFRSEEQKTFEESSASPENYEPQENHQPARVASPIVEIEADTASGNSIPTSYLSSSESTGDLIGSDDTLAAKGLEASSGYQNGTALEENKSGGEETDAPAFHSDPHMAHHESSGASMAAQIQTHIEQALESGVTDLPLGEILNLAEFEHANFTRKRASHICAYVHSLGYELIPNPDTHGIRPRTTSSVRVLRMSDYESELLSSDFYAAVVLIHLSSIVSKADEFVHDSEKDLTRKLLDSMENFSPYELASLNELFEWCFENQISYKGIRRNIKKLSPAGREAAWDQFVDVAVADNVLDPREVIVLDKIYDLLELNPVHKRSRISAVSASIEVQEERKTQSDQAVNISGENSDSTPTIQLERHKVAAGINRDKLAKLRRNNDAVRGLFKDIFNEDDETDLDFSDDDEADESPKTAHSSMDIDTDDTESNLDKKHRKLLRQLLEQDEWQRSEFEKMCGNFDLLPDSAIELINEWSFESVDAPVIEDDGSVFVDRSLNLEV